MARAEDDGVLQRIDQDTWTADVTPSPAPPMGTPFFGARLTPENVIVAELDGVVAGYISLGRATELAASDHVVTVTGLAVDPAARGHGLGRALVEAASDEARRRGARRLTLRVLGGNAVARRLYEAAGFEVEGVLRGEFHLDGAYVDDVLMARTL